MLLAAGGGRESEPARGPSGGGAKHKLSLCSLLGHSPPAGCRPGGCARLAAETELYIATLSKRW